MTKYQTPFSGSLTFAIDPRLTLPNSHWEGLLMLFSIAFLPVRFTYENGPVAQRLEQGTHNPLVPGSNPGGPSLGFGAARKGQHASRRAPPVSNEDVGTMKAFFLIILAFAISVATTEAGPVRTAKNVAKGSVHTAKNVAHSVVKGTKKAVRTVVYTLTP
jgi:hypothetical protein